MNLHKIVIAAAGLILASFQSTAAFAQSYPNRPVKILQGYAAGGNADTIARTVGNEMAKGLGQPIVVEAQAGAGGNIAAATVARSKPDGYTLLLATGGHAVAGALYSSLQYKTVADFEMVSTITHFPFLIVTSSESGIKTFADLLVAGRKSKEGLTFGTAGIGSTHHLAGELLAKMSSTNLLHVPYRGDAASVTALLSNEVSFIIVPPTAAMSVIKAGKLRALATTGEKRWAGMPDLPTIAESGVPGYEVSSWAGLMASAGTPKEIVDRLNQEVQKALQVSAVKSKLEEIGGEAKGSTPAEMKSMVEKELNKWNKVVADAKITKQ